MKHINIFINVDLVYCPNESCMNGLEQQEMTLLDIKKSKTYRHEIEQSDMR